MKKYFAKYLPVEGERNIGDTVIHPGNPPVEVTESNRELLCEDCKRVKLFLCSRDMKPDDEVINIGGYASLNHKGIYVSDSDLGDTCYIRTSLGAEQCIKSHWVKVIGEISPEATWVKEGDEFDEEEVKQHLKNIKAGFEIYFDTEFQEERERILYEIVVDYYLILGPCKRFH